MDQSWDLLLHDPVALAPPQGRPPVVRALQPNHLEIPASLCVATSPRNTSLARAKPAAPTSRCLQDVTWFSSLTVLSYNPMFFSNPPALRAAFQRPLVGRRPGYQPHLPGQSNTAPF